MQQDLILPANSQITKILPIAPITKKEKSPHSLSFQIILSMVLGALTGYLLGEHAAPLGEIGKLVIQLIKTVAAPLLFLAIINAILKAEIRAQDGLRMAAVATFNACLALIIGLSLSNIFQPGRLLSPTALSSATAETSAIVNGAQKIDFLKTLSSYIPSNVVDPFSQNAIISIVILALLLGFGLRASRKDEQSKGQNHYLSVESSLTTWQNAAEKILGWIVLLAPVAVFGVVAKAVGQYGFSPLKGLGAYVAVGLFGLTFHIVVTYQLWIWLYARIPLKKFWAEAKEPAIYSFGANSSLATLPLTLKALDRLGISKSASALGACVGTNLNNDGIILYEAMAVLFVAQAHGLTLSFPEQFMTALFCLIAAVGIAGVPEAGFISLSIVLSTAGLPTEMLPLLLTVDWILARARSVTNVASDMTVSIILDRWMNRSKIN